MGTESRDPRVIKTRESVLSAARDLLAGEGPAAVTPTRLARETGVSRSTIYRNWPDPAALVLDTIADEDARPQFEPTGDPRRDLTTYLELLRSGLEMPHTTLLATRMERAEHDLDMAETIRTSNTHRRRLIADILNETPEPFADIHPLVVGPLFFQRFLAREPITDDLIEHVVDTYLTTRENRDHQ
jgi:AcrR family transcriptional regulator